MTRKLMSGMAILAWLCLPEPAPAHDQVETGVIEIALSGDLAREFNSEKTNFNLGLTVGYFVNDWLELGLVGTGSHNAAGWGADAKALLRVFPFAFAESLPSYLAPFVGLELGALFVEDLDPFITATTSVGIHFFIVENIALSPRLCYGLVYVSGEDLEHILAVQWGLSIFF